MSSNLARLVVPADHIYSELSNELTNHLSIHPFLREKGRRDIVPDKLTNSKNKKISRDKWSPCGYVSSFQR